MLPIESGELIFPQFIDSAISVEQGFVHYGWTSVADKDGQFHCRVMVTSKKTMSLDGLNNDPAVIVSSRKIGRAESVSQIVLRGSSGKVCLGFGGNGIFSFVEVSDQIDDNHEFRMMASLHINRDIEGTITKIWNCKTAQFLEKAEFLEIFNRGGYRIIPDDTGASILENSGVVRVGIHFMTDSAKRLQFLAQSDSWVNSRWVIDGENLKMEELVNFSSQKIWDLGIQQPQRLANSVQKLLNDRFMPVIK